jgi:hypothetical protein
MTVKEIFDNAENGTLTWEQFQTAMGTAKFVDLTEGHYVSKQKYDDDISTRDTQITTLNSTIQTRDSDLATLQQTLTDAGDIAALKQASQDLAELRQKYDSDTKAYQRQLRQQAYEFAVTEYVNGQKFTSKAAKNDFKNQMIAKKLQFEDGKLIGADDFKAMYAQSDPDAFVADTPAPTPAPTPTFVQPTGTSTPAKPTLTQLMQMKNEHPDAIINF